MKGIYLVTGTSRGIGRAVAARLLETGNRVVGISRSPSPLDGEPGYRSVRASVTDTDWIDPLFAEVKDQLAEDGFDMLCLLNNAAVVEPVHAIETCDGDAIRRHVEVNMTAPVRLTARFMAFFGDLDLRRKVVFMTTGAAHSAMPDMAMYCTSKAGLAMFAQCVAREQEDRAGGYEIAQVSPGMVETHMQELARAQDPGDFRPSGMFRSAKAGGAVQDVESVAGKICEILEARTPMGESVSVTKW